MSNITHSSIFIPLSESKFIYLVRNYHYPVHSIKSLTQYYAYILCNFVLLLYEHHIFLLTSGLSGNNFRFLPNGDPTAKYRILNFRQPTPGNFEWVTVGMFEDKKLTVSSDIKLFH